MYFGELLDTKINLVLTSMRKILFILLIVNLFSYKSVLASHVPGGNITYECLGNNQFKITLTLFEDCGTAFISNSPETINITNNCGITGLTSATLNMVVYQDEVSQLCAADLSNSECNGGTYPGVYMHVYEGVVTLPGQCDSWTFSYVNCCRNNSTNVSFASSDNYYFYADLNNLDAPCNNSPQFTAPPIPFSCVGQTVCYNFGIVETDGDSLSFALVSALTGSGSYVSYNSGYSGATPIPGITIDPITGQISFVASQIGNYVVCVQITEYDSNGNVIGVVIRDIQFEVINCSNQVIDCTSSGQIFDLVGNVTQTGPTSLEMCENQGFSFSIAFQDPDANDSLSIITNISTVLPGSTIQVIHPDSAANQYDSVVVNIAWTPPVGSANSNNAFTITVNDNACPVSGQQTIVYYINVLGVTTIYSDTTLCVGQTATLIVDAELATSYNWSVISGDPINIGSNFSCNNCDTVYASPVNTTVYSVTTNGVCSTANSDTVTVTVVPDYTYSMSISDPSICLGDTSFLTLTFNPTGTYGLIWEDQTDIIYGVDTLIVPTTTGQFVKPYLVHDAPGCYKADTISYSVSNISISAVAFDEVCFGASDGYILSTGISDYNIANYDLTGNSTATNTNGTFTSLSPGNYTVTVVDDSLCSASTNLVIGPGTIVSGQATGDTTLCIGQSVPMTANANLTSNYTWNVLSGDPIVVGTNFTCNNCLSTVATPSITTVYQVVSNGTCGSFVIDTVTVNVVPDFTYFVTLSDQSICEGDSSIIHFTGTPASNYVLNWSNMNDIVYGTDSLLIPSTTGNGSIPFIVTDLNGCSKAGTLDYFVSTISLSTNVVDETCLGNSDGIINATGTGDYQMSSYTIAGPNGTSTNANGSFSGLDPGTYTVTVVDDSLCTTSQVVSIANGVVVGGTSTTDSTTCSYTNDGLIHIVGNSGNSPYSYQLFYTSGVSVDSNGTGIFNVGEGTYSYNVYDVNGCVYSGTAVVGGPLPVVASFTESDNWGVEPLTVTFTNQSQNANAYLWYIDSTTSVTTNPVYTFVEGDYSITLFAYNGVCVDSVTQTLTVVAKSYIIVPNVFSPDGNMENDFFYIKYHRITNFHIDIFNRWGKRVFESDDVAFKWNGKNKGGKDMDEGTYYYIITATGEDKVEHEEKGSLMLLRD